jgi:hypothetical protein
LNKPTSLSFLADGQRQKKDKKIININFIIMVVGGVCVCVWMMYLK